MQRDTYRGTEHVDYVIFAIRRFWACMRYELSSMLWLRSSRILSCASSSVFMLTPMSLRFPSTLLIMSRLRSLASIRWSCA